MKKHNRGTGKIPGMEQISKVSGIFGPVRSWIPLYVPAQVSLNVLFTAVQRRASQAARYERSWCRRMLDSPFQLFGNRLIQHILGPDEFCIL